MIVIKGQRWLWKDFLVFFPDKEEIAQLLANLGSTTILRVRQTAVEISNHKALIQKGIFRTSCIDLTKSLEEIYREMDAKSCRYEIRKAEKEGERVQVSLNERSAQNDFLLLYNNFVRLKGHAHPMSKRRFEEYVKTCDVWVVYYDGRPFCGHLVARDDRIGRTRLLYSATCRLNSQEDAKMTGPLNRYLHWYEIKFYKEMGIKIYDFGGIGDGTSSIAKFKLSFGGFRVEEYSYVFAGNLGRLAYKIYRVVSHMRTR